MSEEKTLTDEATIDSLKEMAIKFSKDIYVNRVLANAINLIQDLQAENESFGETINEASETLRNQRAKIERLKINLANEKKWGKIQAKQVEKETARKIFGDIESCIEGMLDGERYMTKNEVEYFLEHILNKKQEYDVGVDYEN